MKADLEMLFVVALSMLFGVAMAAFAVSAHFDRKEHEWRTRNPIAPTIGIHATDSGEVICCARVHADDAGNLDCVEEP